MSALRFGLVPLIGVGLSPSAPSGHLRNNPRQARSAARVEALLDAAAEVFEEVGYDAATTNLVATRAGVPVGTLYRWFPDKSALAEALTDRYLQRVQALYMDAVSQIRPDQRIGDFLNMFLYDIANQLRSERALTALLVSAMVPGRHSSAGERLRAGLTGEVRNLIDVRIPGIPAAMRDQTAEVCVTLIHLVIAAGTDDDEGRREIMVREYIDVLHAYLEAKFPSENSPAWTDPDVPIKPRFAAPNREARVAASPPSDA